MYAELAIDQWNSDDAELMTKVVEKVKTWGKEKENLWQEDQVVIERFVRMRMVLDGDCKAENENIVDAEWG